MNKVLIALVCITWWSTSARGLELPAGRVWVDPPGWIGQCFVCPDQQTSDCIDAEPIYLEIQHDHMLHVTQRYVVAWSEATNLPYYGTLSLTVQYLARDEAMARVSVHWLRGDGLGVRIVQQVRLRYMDEGVQVIHQHDSFACH